MSDLDDLMMNLLRAAAMDFVGDLKSALSDGGITGEQFDELARIISNGLIRPPDPPQAHIPGLDQTELRGDAPDLRQGPVGSDGCAGA